jgi:phage repressor protein C with HTH and peptisase S24 domain
MPKRSDISDRRIPVNRAVELLGSEDAVRARAGSYRTWRDWVEYGVPPKHLADVLSASTSEKSARASALPPIPVFGFGSAGEGIVTDDAGYPVGTGEFVVPRSTGNQDPRSYATRVKGESMYPYLFDGDVVEVRTDLEVRSGDVAVILHEDGRKWIKRVRISRSKPVITCQPINGGHEPFELPADKVRLHKIISIRRKGMY